MCCCLLAQAQDYQVNLKSWDVKDGLSDRQVNFIYKDSRGLIWLCTKKGITCFDSHRFQVFNKDKDGLPFDFLAKMVEDADGLFWILGSPRFDKNNLFIFNPMTKQVISIKDKTGYTGELSLNYLQKFNDSVLFFGDVAKAYFFTWSERDGLKKIPFPIKGPTVVTVTAHNTFWLQDSAAQLCEVDLHGRLMHTYRSSHRIKTWAGEPGISSYAIHVPMPGQKRTYMPAYGVRVKGDSAELVNFYPNFGRVEFRTGVDSVMFKGGHLLSGRVLVKDLQEESFYMKSSNCVLLDEYGRIWMGNVFGFSMLTVTRNRFRKFFYQDIKTFSHNSYRTLVADKEKLYAVCEFKGVGEASIDSDSGGFIGPTPKLLSGNYSLVKPGAGNLFGMQINYLYELDKTWHVTDIPDHGAKANYWRILEVAPDSFLVTTSAGLKWFSYKKKTFFPFNGYNQYTELTDALVLDVVNDGSGKRWFCSRSGLYEYDDVKGITGRYSSDDTDDHYLPAKDVQHIYCDADGIYWIAAANGLVRWDRKQMKYRLFTIADGLSNNNIYAVYEDSLHRLWLSSDYGIMQFNKSDCRVKTFLVGDGITYNEFNRLSHTRDDRGNIYFGSLDGVTGFDPNDFPAGNEDEKNATLVVSLFEQFNGASNRLIDRTAEIIRSPEITLHPGDRFFNLNFALLAYNDALHTTYYWKIDGIDSGWISLKEPTLRISGLPYGTATLRIKAQASDGAWGRNELQFTIYVIKPFYLRIGFIIIAVLTLVICIVAGYRWRVFLLSKENERLDNIVKEKTAALNDTIAELQVSARHKDILMKEIHHRVKNNLQIISTLLNLQLSKIEDYTARRSLEESASRISSIALVHYQLYKGTHLTAIEIAGFTSELLTQLQGVYLKPEQELLLENDIPETWLDIDTALPLGLILNELMTNSFKYAYVGASVCHLRIALTHRDNAYTLKYCDSGPGLPEGYNILTGKSLGMTIIKSLSKQLGGKFEYRADDNCFLVSFLDTNARKNIA